MRIRRARKSEAPLLTALAVEAKRHWDYSPEDIERWRPLLSIVPDDVTSKPTFVAEVADKVAGFYLLAPTPEGFELDHLWVSPSFARQGIGRALLTHAVNTARLAGVSSIAIDADPNAEAFYVACGAVRRGVVPAPIQGNPARVRPQLSLEITT